MAVQKELQEDPKKDFFEAESLLSSASNHMRTCNVHACLSKMNIALRVAPICSDLFETCLKTRNSCLTIWQRTCSLQASASYFSDIFSAHDTTLFPPALEENTDFPFASKSIKIVRTSEMGRHVVSSSKISRGDILFVEKPVASVLISDFEGEYCHSCFRRLYSIVPCDICACVAYCSNSCKKTGWDNHHSIECGYTNFLHSVGIAHLALRCILSVGSYEKLTTSLVVLESRRSKENKRSLRILRGYEAINDLDFHHKNIPFAAIASYGLMALLLAVFLRDRTNYLPRDAGKDVIENVANILLKHILQLICNAHSVVVPMLCTTSSDQCNVTERIIATGIYPSASIMNHSCRPNIINSFIGNTLIVRCAEDMEENESVYNCYGPRETQMNREDRQEILKNQFGFNCSCDACTASIEHLDSLEAYKCQACCGPLHEVRRPMTVHCWLCPENTTISAKFIYNLDQVRRTRERFEGGSIVIEDIAENFTNLLEAWRYARKYLHYCNVDLISLTSILADWLSKMGYFKLSALLLWVAFKPAMVCYSPSPQEKIKYLSVMLLMAEFSLQKQIDLDQHCRGLMFEIKQKALEEIQFLKTAHYFFIQPAIAC